MSERSRFQDGVGSITRLLELGVAEGIFPGATACVSFFPKIGDPIWMECAAGTMTRQKIIPMSPGALFDLASLTKPMVATAALRLIASGKLSEETVASEMVMETGNRPVGQATLNQLLRHASGLKSWSNLYERLPYPLGSLRAKRWMLREAARCENESRDAVVYSDLGYLIAGEFLERSTEMSLNHLLAEQITDPLGISNELFYPMANPSSMRNHWIEKTAPTHECPWRKGLLWGVVQDENAAAFGGIAGHAGLFGTAGAVARFGRTMLDVGLGRSAFLPPYLLKKALTPQQGTSYRLGWCGKSRRKSAFGKSASNQGFGHLGYTGTSLWCEPERDLVVCLLTNQVHLGEDHERMRTFRSMFHDGVAEIFE